MQKTLHSEQLAVPRGRARRWLRAAAVAVIAGGMLLAVTPTADAQGRGRNRQDLIKKLTGKRVRVDAATGAPQPISEADAAALIDQIAVLTTRTAPEAPVELPRGGTMVSLSGHGVGHVLVSRPNEDGTSSVRCVTSAEEAVDFLAGDLDSALPLL